eukprot:3423909-Pleurochrysis_carterae.AAC.1
MHVRPRMRTRMRAHASACACARVRVCVLAFESACLRSSQRACERVRADLASIAARARERAGSASLLPAPPWPSSAARGPSPQAGASDPQTRQTCARS